MRIQKAHTERQQEIANSKVAGDKGGRFSKILEARRQESMPQYNVLAQGERPGLPEVAGKSAQVSSAPVSTDIERLASEIVDHISSHQARGACSVEIQFNSQVLAGLRVNVRSEQGSISVNFLTAAPSVAAVVQKNLGSLRAALEGKGVRVSNLAVVSRSTG
ncbi:MAG: flagellar hook-length control protein FliK [Acidobacteriaceae bacterium]|nr:flagellar hook-length control protein FliK [Acidobacteriaceae bacterium]MBV9294082.1 flagellar hook-length control protein FliK [Acidobacteriaceae bacterium]MBV9764836.1 flagellar hook-length control protein FliK [Acidobacteriaceae bacterium]